MANVSKAPESTLTPIICGCPNPITVEQQERKRRREELSDQYIHASVSSSQLNKGRVVWFIDANQYFQPQYCSMQRCGGNHRGH
jgi:hypothetical protein